MADPLSLLLAVISAVKDAKELFETFQGNTEECQRTMDRLLALEPALLALVQAPANINQKALENLLKVVDDIKATIKKFNESTWYRWGQKWAEASKWVEEFASINQRLSIFANDLNHLLFQSLRGEERT